MVAGQVSSFGQSWLPSMQPLHVFLVILETLCVLSEMFTVTPTLMSYVSRIHAIENRQNETTRCLRAVNDVDKFVHTKWRRGIVDRKHRNEDPRLFNGIVEWWFDFIPSLQLTVINEGVDSVVSKSLVEMASKTVTSVTAPEAKEHLVSESIGKWRGWGRWLRSHENWEKLNEKRVWECKIWV